MVFHRMLFAYQHLITGLAQRARIKWTHNYFWSVFLWDRIKKCPYHFARRRSPKAASYAGNYRQIGILKCSYTSEWSSFQTTPGDAERHCQADRNLDLSHPSNFLNFQRLALWFVLPTWGKHLLTGEMCATLHEGYQPALLHELICSGDSQELTVLIKSWDQTRKTIFEGSHL